MDALKELSTVALETLKHEFFLQQGSDGIDEEGFIDVITRVCTEHNTTIIPTDAEIRKFFAAVDVFGDGCISWNAFLMHTVDSLRRRLYEGIDDKERGEVLLRPFHIREVLKNGHANRITEIRVLHKSRRVIKVITENNGLSTLHMCDARQHLLSIAAIKRYPCSLLAWDYIPLVREIPFSNALVCSYNDCYLRFFSLRKKRYDGVLENCHCMRMSESQSVLRWVPSSNLLAMGSHTGMVSLWDLQRQVKVIEKRLFHSTVTAIRSYKEFLYVASLDSRDAVKCFNIERGVVSFSLNDHDTNGALILESDDHYLYSSGFGRNIVQRSLVVPRTPPIYFYDHMQPHKGRITALQRLQGVPILVSGDTRGTLKFWDLRMGFCVQTIHGSGNNIDFSPYNCDEEVPELERGLSGYRAARIYSICHLDMVGRLKVATSRELIVLSADAFLRPELTDDHHICRFLFFPNPDSIITVHDRCVKLWDSLTGLLTDVTEPNIIKYDVTASCTVQPLNRQLIIGTIGGEIKALSVAMLQETINLTPILQMHLHDTEIINLHTIARYRDATIPHVFIVTQHAIFLVPLKSDCSSQSVIHFHGILRSFMRHHQVIRATSVTETRLLLATSDACVHVVEYQGIVTHTHTFSLSADVETIIARPLMATTTDDHNENVMNIPISSLSNEIAFFSDVTGRVHIVLMRQSFSTHTERPSKHAHKYRSKGVPLDISSSSSLLLSSCEELGSWCPRNPNSWTRGEGRTRTQSGISGVGIGSVSEYYRRPGTRSTSLDFILSENKLHHHVYHHHHHSRQHLHREETQKEKKEEFNPVVNTTDTTDGLSLHTATSSAVLMVYFDREQVLVTVDDTGEICSWDVAGVLAYIDRRISATSIVTNTNTTTINTTTINTRRSSVNSNCSIHSNSSRSTSMTNPNPNFNPNFNPNIHVTVPFTDVACGPPLLITAWRAAQHDILRLAAAEHPALRLPLLITATTERRVLLWSMDGAALGVLAAGRRSGEENSAIWQSGVQPYRLMCSRSTTVAQWANFIAYMQRRKEQGHKQQERGGGEEEDGRRRGGQEEEEEEEEQGQRLQGKKCDSLLYSNIHRFRYLRQAPQIQLKAKGRRDECRVSIGIGTVSSNSRIRASVTSELPFALPQCPTVSISTTKHLCSDGMRNSTNRITDNGSEKVFDKDKEESMMEYEQHHTRGGNSIVKPMHQRLVTRRRAPLSVERTGMIGLPPLFSGKQQHQRRR